MSDTGEISTGRAEQRPRRKPRSEGWQSRLREYAAVNTISLFWLGLQVFSLTTHNRLLVFLVGMFGIPIVLVTMTIVMYRRDSRQESEPHRAREVHSGPRRAEETGISVLADPRAPRRLRYRGMQAVWLVGGAFFFLLFSSGFLSESALGMRAITGVFALLGLWWMGSAPFLGAKLDGNGVRAHNLMSWRYAHWDEVVSVRIGQVSTGRSSYDAPVVTLRGGGELPLKNVRARDVGIVRAYFQATLAPDATS